VLPWLLHGLAEAAQDDVCRRGNLAKRVIHRLTRAAFGQRQAAAFRYLEVVAYE